MTATAEPRTAAHGNQLTRYMRRNPTVALVVVAVAFYLLTGIGNTTLFTSGGLRSILLLTCPLALLAIAETVCMLVAGIDLSTTMIANFTAYVCAVNTGLGVATSIVLALVVGLVVGAINGIGVGVFRINALIMTLGMSSVLIGVLSAGITGSGFLSGPTVIPRVVNNVASGRLFGPIPANLVLIVVVALVFAWGFAHTGLGKTIYAVGDNERAVHLAGVRAKVVLVAVYSLAGLLAAIAGLVFTGINGAVGPDATTSFLLPAIAAAVVGGTSIFGGVGTISGTVCGAFILTVLNSFLLNLHANDAVQQVIYGVIILALSWLYVSITGRARSV